mmetsp:Transcript_46340/g.122413  ORF Transcript_46340/g.122413 Transcript_46340/m.122413 type:complete len:85 (+) Transcript_46340:597-851(+)
MRLLPSLRTWRAEAVEAGEETAHERALSQQAGGTAGSGGNSDRGRDAHSKQCSLRQGDVKETKAAVRVVGCANRRWFMHACMHS